MPKPRFRLVPNATQRAYSIEVSFWDERSKIAPHFKDGYGYWRTVEIDNNPIYFVSESNAREYIKDYKEWLEKEPIEIE